MTLPSEAFELRHGAEDLGGRLGLRAKERKRRGKEEERGRERREGFKSPRSQFRSSCARGPQCCGAGAAQQQNTVAAVVRKNCGLWAPSRATIQKESREGHLGSS